MKITKHKTDRPGIWQIHVDGRPTALTIEKGEPPEWGDTQDWHLHLGDRYIMTCRRANDVIPTIEGLLAALGVLEKA